MFDPRKDEDAPQDVESFCGCQQNAQRHPVGLPSSRPDRLQHAQIPSVPLLPLKILKRSRLEQLLVQRKTVPTLAIRIMENQEKGDIFPKQ